MASAKKHGFSAELAACEEAVARLSAAACDRLQCALLLGGTTRQRDLAMQVFSARQVAEGIAVVPCEITNKDPLAELSQRLAFSPATRRDAASRLREWMLRLAVLELERSMICLIVQLGSPLTADDWLRISPLFARAGTVFMLISAQSRELLPACALEEIDLVAEIADDIVAHPRAVDLAAGLASLAAVEEMLSR